MTEKTSIFKIARTPYGAFSVAPIILSVIAWIFTAVAAFNCTTFRLTVTPNGTDPTTLHFGYTALQDDTFCVAAPPRLIDEPLKTGNALGIVATVFGVLQVIAVICTTCVVYPKAVFKGLSAVGVTLALFSVLVVSVGFATENCSNDQDVNPFIGLIIDDELSIDDGDSPALKSYASSCRLGTAGYVGIIGCLCWIAAAVTLLIMPRKKRENLDDGNKSLPPSSASNSPDGSYA